MYYIPSTEKDKNEMCKKLLGFIDTIDNKYIKKLLDEIFNKNKTVADNLKKHSAARTLHHGYLGGLLEHTLSVTEICDFMSNRYKRVDRDILICSAMLHDIGKLKLRSYINGQESNPMVIEELKYVRMHSTLGYEELKDQGYSDFVLESILYHHENYDGSGYPSNLAGKEIPIGARILRVCDVFCALSQERSYRKAFDKHTVMELMIDEIKNFDLEVFLAFQRVVHASQAGK